MRSVTGLRLSDDFLDYLERKAEENSMNRSQYMRNLMIYGIAKKEAEEENLADLIIKSSSVVAHD